MKPPDDGPVLVADSIGRSFARRRVLTTATVRVFPGRITALLGRNGCGKTTLLRIITGLTRADHGGVWFRGVRRPRPRLARIAMEGLFFLPERDLLGRGRPLADHVHALQQRWPEARPAMAEAVRLMDIEPLLGRITDRLSGGECRRAELALALARQPACLLADEPFHGIAPRDIEVVAAALRSLADAGAGVLVTGHEVEALLHLADDIVWMTAGTTHELGPPEQAARHDQFRREYLGPRTLLGKV